MHDPHVPYVALSLSLESPCERTVEQVAVCVCPQCAAACFSPDDTCDVCDTHDVKSCVEPSHVHVQLSSSEHSDSDTCQEVPSVLRYDPAIVTTSYVCPACGHYYQHVLPVLNPVEAMHVAWQSYERYHHQNVYVRTIVEPGASRAYPTSETPPAVQHN